MKYIPIFFITLYRKLISPLKPPSCRFTPTCSAYAITAFQKRGFFVGLYLMITRILRCNPFGRSGYDPVPEKRKRLYKPLPKYRPVTRRKNGAYPKASITIYGDF